MPKVTLKWEQAIGNRQISDMKIQILTQKLKTWSQRAGNPSTTTKKQARIQEDSEIMEELNFYIQI